MTTSPTVYPLTHPNQHPAPRPVEVRPGMMGARVVDIGVITTSMRLFERSVQTAMEYMMRCRYRTERAMWDDIARHRARQASK